jgi:hypothetical protein
LKMLRLIFDEAFLLTQERWGCWNRDPAQLFTEMLSFIASYGDVFNQMLEDISEQKRTENEYFAKVAEDYHGFDELSNLAKAIEAKAKYKARR